MAIKVEHNKLKGNVTPPNMATKSFSHLLSQMLKYRFHERFDMEDIMRHEFLNRKLPFKIQSLFPVILPE